MNSRLGKLTVGRHVGEGMQTTSGVAPSGNPKERLTSSKRTKSAKTDPAEETQPLNNCLPALPSILDDLKAKVASWEESLQIRNLTYLKQAEAILKECKRNKNWAYKQVVLAKKELKKAKTKLSSYPSNQRRWAKQNMDKVLELIEK